MHICLVEVAKLVVFLIFWVELQEIVWSDLHTSISQHIIATYGYSLTCHVQKVSCLSSECVWYIHVAYTTSSWPAALTLCASLAVLITEIVSCNTHLKADTVNLYFD